MQTEEQEIEQEEIMNESDLNKMAEKVADILIARFEAKQQELAESQSELLLNTSLNSLEDYKERFKGKTCREIMESIND